MSSLTQLKIKKVESYRADQNILFVNLPTLSIQQIMSHDTSRQIKAFPFGILYLSGVLKNMKHRGQIACVDYLPIEHEIFRGGLDEVIQSEAKKAVGEWSPDILAFSFQDGFYTQRLILPYRDIISCRLS